MNRHGFLQSGWLFFGVVACTAGQDTAQQVDVQGWFSSEERSLVESLSPLPPLPVDPTNAVSDDARAAQLGQWLFFDPALSSDESVSCATCHDPALGFGDGQRLSTGVAQTRRHALSIWNGAYNRWFYWDGRCDTMWCQALQPLEHPDEMNSSRLAVAHHIHAEDALRSGYESIFGSMPDLTDTTRFPLQGRPDPDHPDDPLVQAWEGMAPTDQEAINAVFVNVGKAIAAYERLLVTGAAPLDDYVAVLTSEGEDAARASGHLSASAERGLKLFVGDANCHFCHAGPNLTNGEFHNIGLADQEWLDPADTGRYDGIAALLAEPFRGNGPYSDDPEAAALKLDHLVQGPEQLGQFKVPTLRNVATNAPYMHGGQLETLEDVIQFYNEVDEEVSWGHREELLVPLSLDEQDVADLVAFLESLTGEGPDASLLVAPTAPQR